MSTINPNVNSNASQNMPLITPGYPLASVEQSSPHASVEQKEPTKGKTRDKAVHQANHDSDRSA